MCIYVYIHLFRYTYIHIFIHICVHICEVMWRYGTHIYMYLFAYIWHWSRRLVSHTGGLQSTPLDARRDGNMSAADFSKNYDTRVKLWPLLCQNVIFSNKTMNSPYQWLFSYTWRGSKFARHGPEFARRSPTSNSTRNASISIEKRLNSCRNHEFLSPEFARRGPEFARLGL